MKNIEITQEIMKEFFTNEKVTLIEGLLKNRFLYYYYQLIKVNLNKHFYIIYMAKRWFNENEIFIPSKIEVCGYLKKSNNYLFNPNYDLCEFLKGLQENSCIQYTNFTDLNINDILSKRLTQEIKNNWDNLKNEKHKNVFSNIEYAKTNKAKEKAIEWVVEDHLYAPPEYQYQYDIEINMENEDYIEYLSNPEEYIKNKINQIMNNKNKLALFFESIITYESAVSQMSDILNNPDIQHEKDIKDCLNNIEAKTVTIKVIKDNKEWIGKINTSDLKNCRAYNWIPMYKVSKKDRDNFKQSFGKNSDLYPEDIEEIIFRNKIIYKRGE